MKFPGGACRFVFFDPDRRRVRQNACARSSSSGVPWTTSTNLSALISASYFYGALFRNARADQSRHQGRNTSHCRRRFEAANQRHEEGTGHQHGADARDQEEPGPEEQSPNAGRGKLPSRPRTSSDRRPCNSRRRFPGCGRPFRVMEIFVMSKEAALSFATACSASVWLL